MTFFLLMEGDASYTGVNQILKQLYQDRIGRGKVTPEKIIVGGFALTIYQQPGLGVGSTINEKIVGDV